MIGERLGKWVLDSELGRGGMGCVYRAHDDEGRLAAVKLLAPELTTHAGAVSRFQREIDVLSKLNHPHIVRLFESGSHHGQLYFVMEYVDGRDLASLLQEQGRLPWPEVLALAIQVCAALKHAHDHGVIHRDLKPSNLLRTADGQVKLTDFGVAHVFAAEHLTRTGTVVGTAEYLSPEQAAGKPATKRSDLYSLGVVLYTLVCGRTPFQGHDMLAILHKHRFGQFDPPARLVPDLPADVNEVICGLLEKSPERRPPDAGVLQRRLEVLRQKLQRRDDPTRPAVSAVDTLGTTVLAATTDAPRHVEGPATLMSRLMRRHLEEENHGGPLRQFLNRPAVLVTLFLLCVGTLVWTLWPASPEALFRRGQELMASDDPEQWEQAFKYFDKLPADDPHRAEVESHRQRLEQYRAERAAARVKGKGAPAGEAQWFYQQGLRLRQQGDEAAADAMWRNLVRAFRDVPAEQTWVRLAEQELARQQAGESDARRWSSVRAALERARRLRQEGKAGEADEVLAALEALYHDDPSARDILAEVRRERGQ